MSKSDPDPTLRGVEVEGLTVKDALDLAIHIEEEARDRYQELAEQLTLHHTPAAAAFFTRMIAVEEKHRAQLVERRKKAFGDQVVSVTAELFFDIEAPEYDEVRTFMSVKEALQAALRSEVKAHAFFVRAIASVSDPGVKALFAELRDEEIEHQALVEKELAKLDGGPRGNPDDYADDPVAQ